MIGSILPIDRFGMLSTGLLWMSLISGMFYLFLFLYHASSTAFAGDFTVFHGAANAIVGHELTASDVYQIDKLSRHMSELYAPKGYCADCPYLYPPITTLLLLPIGFHEIVPAHIAWGLSTILAAAISAWLLGARGLALAALAINPMTLTVAGYGQTAALPTLALCTSLYFARRQNSFGFGSTLAAMSIKPQTAVAGFLLLAANRNITAISSCILTLIALFIVSGLWLGFGTWVAFFEAGLQFSKTLGLQDHINLQSLLSVFAIAKFFGGSDAVARLAHVFSVFLVLLIVFQRPTVEVMITASLLIPIYNLSTSYMLLLVPATLLLLKNPRSFATHAYLFCYAFIAIIDNLLEPVAADAIENFTPMLGIIVWCLLVLAAKMPGTKITHVC